MIGRIGERRQFQRLTDHGRRARTSTLWCRYLDDPTVGPPQVAFSIGRPVGSAVARNRLRRRLRAIVADLARGDEALLRGGALLVGARPAATERSFGELVDEMTSLLRQVVAP